MPSISKIKIKNFLSLKEVEMELGKLNILVGPNASGKSNIARALRLLANHAGEGFPILPGYKSIKELTYNFDETVEIELTVEAIIKGRKAKYTLTLTADGYVEYAWINDKKVLEYDSTAPTYKEGFILSNQGETIRIIWKDFHHSPLFGKNMLKSPLSSLPSNTLGELCELARLLKSISVHSFTPERIRAYSDIKSPPILGYYGDNLARTLLHLYLEDRRILPFIEHALQSFIPEVEEIIPHIEGTSIELWLRVKGLSEPLRPGNISDGTLRMLAFIVALYSKPSLAVFEEPENCIHPHLLEALIHLTRKAPCQTIITTHSPHLLDYINTEEVYIVEKTNTATTIKKLEKMEEIKAVKKLLEEGGTLGEAWYSGLIGGTLKAE